MYDIALVLAWIVAIGLGFYALGRAAWPLLLLGLLLVFLSGCTTVEPYVELGAGFNTSFTNQTHKWEDGGAGPLGAKIVLGVDGVVKNNPHMRAGCAIEHYSHWFVGPPFNNNAESSLDHIGCSVRMNLRGRRD